MRCRGMARIAKSGVCVCFTDQHGEKTVWPKRREVNPFVCSVMSFLSVRLEREWNCAEAHRHLLTFVTP